MSYRFDGVLERRLGHHPSLYKLVKYSAASVAGVVSSFVTLNTCLLLLDMAPVPANIIAVTVGSIPNYLINRAWTFSKSGTHSFSREILPFWLMAVLGLVLSTISVAWAAERWDDNPVAINLANIGAFGTLWVAKFFILERILFKPLAHAVEVVEEHLH